MPAAIIELVRTPPSYMKPSETESCEESAPGLPASASLPHVTRLNGEYGTGHQK